jgi:predicted nucleic acid-binding protein
MIVVSDTSPICYLLLINQIDILPALYRVVIVPKIVADELGAFESPPIVKSWIAQPPTWLEIQPIELPQRIELGKLDPGERDAILLAEHLQADLVILDDKSARQIAVECGLKIIGLLGIVKDAAKSGLLDLELTFEQLQDAGFWVSPSLLERLLLDD